MYIPYNNKLYLQNKTGYSETSEEKGLQATYDKEFNDLFPPWARSYYGGELTQITKFPWTASIKHYSKHRCSGTIISANRILTAAKCTTGLQPTSLQVRVGSTDSKSGGQYLYVQSIHNHPLYNASSHENDLSVMWLKTNINLAAIGVQAVSLPIQDEHVEINSLAAVSGWEECEGCYEGNVIRFSVVTLVSNERCNTYYRGGIQEGMICGDGTDGEEPPVTERVCQRDYGGPVVEYENNILMGVVSWGHGCLKKIRPGVYTRVAFFKDWIISVV